MKTNIIKLTVKLALLIASSSVLYAQTSNQTQRVVEICSLLGHTNIVADDFTVTSHQEPNSTDIELRTDKITVRLLDNDLQSFYFNNDALENDIYNNKDFDGNKKVMTNENLEVIAKNIASSVAFPESTEVFRITRSDRLTPNEQGFIEKRGIVSVELWQTVNHISTRGFGNSLQIQLDHQTGELVSVICKLGWTYPEPVNLISAEQAKQIADSLTEAPLISEHGLIYVVSDKMGTKPERVQNKECTLVYSFVYENNPIAINAVDGEVEMKGTFLANQTDKNNNINLTHDKVDKTSNNDNSTIPEDKQRPLPWIPIALGGLTSIGVAGWLIKSRAK